MRKTCGMNKYQKAAHKPGEPRVGREEIVELVELSHSNDPEDRLLAAQFLCPCHVRKRIDVVWEALYRMLQDPDVRVRRAAWHTLEDGGRPDDPALDAIFDRARQTESDPAVRRFIGQLDKHRNGKAKVRIAMQQALAPRFRQRGRCDFCGEDGRFVERDLETMIPTTDLPRAALICEACARKQQATARR